MVKRHRRVVDDGDGDSGEDYTPVPESVDIVETPTQEDTPLIQNQNQANLDNYLWQNMSLREKEIVVSYGVKLSKAAMAAELKGQVITRGYISKYVMGDERGIKLSYVLKYAQLSLLKLGYELVELPLRDGGKRQSSYVLKSVLPAKLRNVIGHYFIGASASSDGMGLIVLIICTILLHRNSMGKTELLKLVRQFGILDQLFEDIIKRSVREEYVLEERVANKRRRAQGGSSDNDDFVQYHLGRRALVEFPRDSIILLIEEIYGDTMIEQDRAQTSFDWMLELSSTGHVTQG